MWTGELAGVVCGGGICGLKNLFQQGREVGVWDQAQRRVLKLLDAHIAQSAQLRDDSHDAGKKAHVLLWVVLTEEMEQSLGDASMNGLHTISCFQLTAIC